MKSPLTHGAALILALSASVARSQTIPSADPDKPLPDIPTLMRQVEANERRAEAIQRDYIYREDREINHLDNSGGIKKEEESAYEIFWIDGVPVERLIRKDGKDLAPDELKKENDRIDKEVEKAKERRARNDANHIETDAEGHSGISAARILELGTFSNPRREYVDGRPTIVVHYLGDPNAKTNNRTEAAFKDLEGNVWVDEDSRALQHVEGHFVNDFKIGGGLVMNIHGGFRFEATNRRVNNEVWLPAAINANGFFRYLLFFSVNGEAHFRFSEYRKFKASSTILPGITPTEPESSPSDPAHPPPAGSSTASPDPTQAAPADSHAPPPAPPPNPAPQ
jgi:hypothetical protein